MILELISKAAAASKNASLTGDGGQLNLQLKGGVDSIPALLNSLLPWIGLTAGALAFAYLLYSGFLYLTAGGNAEAAKKGQTGILNAILGLVIIGIAYTITTALVGTLSN